MTSEPTLNLNFDERQEKYLRQLVARADALATDQAITRWERSAIKAEISRCLALMQLTTEAQRTPSTLVHLLGTAYWFPDTVDERLRRSPQYAAPLLESIAPLLYYFGPEQYRIIFERDGALRVCIYTRLHPQEANDRYDRFTEEWLASEHPAWPDDIAWDLCIVRDDTPFAAVVC
jgi:hypothetical protein